MAVLIFVLGLCWRRPRWFRLVYRVAMTASFYLGQFMGRIMLALFFLAVAYFLHAWLKRRQHALCRRMLVWLLVGAFALSSAMEASLFRAGLGADQALASRYVTFSICLPVALVILVALICVRVQKQFSCLAAADRRGPHERRHFATVLQTCLDLYWLPRPQVHIRPRI